MVVVLMGALVCAAGIAVIWFRKQAAELRLRWYDRYWPFQRRPSAGTFEVEMWYAAALLLGSGIFIIVMGALGRWG